MSTLFDCGYYTETELAAEDFKSLGSNVRIDKNCTIIGTPHISIGSNVRIDGYCTLLAIKPHGIQLGSYIHIGAYCHLNGGEGIVMEDFCGLSQGVRIYTRNDDYTGQALTNPTVPAKYTRVTKGAVFLKRHVLIGSGSVVLPGVTIGEGSCVGALSLVTKSLESWGVYLGCPLRRLYDRSKKLLELEQEFRQGLPPREKAAL
jgi:acetyltransferase-like isoleucine patch superfamily enzyme